MSEARRGQIEESFTGVSSSNDYLERTSHVLALISSGLGVALASSTTGQVLEHIHFSRLSTGRVLAVLVTQAGAVQDRVLAVDQQMTHGGSGDGGNLFEREFPRLADRADPCRSGSTRGDGARSVSGTADVG